MRVGFPIEKLSRVGNRCKLVEMVGQRLLNAWRSDYEFTV